jgi:hypothetical protein
MADRNGEALQRAQRLERSISSAITGVLFGPERDGPYSRGGASLLADLRALGRGGDQTVIRTRLADAGIISRAVASTTTTDVPSLLSVTAPGWVQSIVERRQAANVAMLAGLRTGRLSPGSGGVPFIMSPSPPIPATAQSAEKTELASRTFTEDDGESILPTTIGETADFSRQVLDWGGDAVLALLVEDVVAGVAAYVAEALAAAAAPVATVAAGCAAVEAAGWPPTHVAGPTSTLLGEDLERLARAGLAILAAPAATGILVISAPGVVFEDTEVQLVRQPAPSLLGSDVSAIAYALARVAPGAVAAVSAP